MPIRTEDQPTSAPLKPRKGRSWAMGCFGAAALVGLATWGYVAWANMVPPMPKPPAVTLPNPNGYDAVLAVLPKMSTPSPTSQALGTPRQASLEDLRKAVQAKKPALEELRRALKLPYLNPPVRDPNDTYYQSMAGLRQAARVLASESRVEMESGRRASGWRSGLDAIELGAKCQRGGVVIHMLVGVAIAAIGASGLDGQVEGLTPAEARAAGQRLDRVIAEVPGMDALLTEEQHLGRIYFRKAIQAPPEMIDPYTDEEKGWTEKAQAVALRYLYPKSWAYGALEDYYSRSLAEARKPSWQRASLPEPNDPYVEQLVMDPSGFERARSRMMTTLHLLRLQLALAEYHGRRGAYPAQLTELKLLLPELPVDPFTGRSYVYRRTENTYLLYGVGENAVDDGGTPSLPGNYRTGDLVAGKLFPRRSPAPPPPPGGGYPGM